MVATASTSTSLKDYLKKYESNAEEDKKRKKKKKPKVVASGVMVVDEDPVWQKPVNLEEDEESDSPDEKPLVDEDIEVKRMKRLELLRARRAYNEISEDGSGWVSVSDVPKHSTLPDHGLDLSPPRNRTRCDTPSPENRVNFSESARDNVDMSPPRQRRRRNDSPSPEVEHKPSGLQREDIDLSPPRQCRRHSDSPSPEAKHKSSGLQREDNDLSPPRQLRRRNDSPSPAPQHKSFGFQREGSDLSPPRQQRKRYDSPSPERDIEGSDQGRESDLSPPRRHRSSGPSSVPKKGRSIYGVEDSDLGVLSPPRRIRPSSPKFNASRDVDDLSPPRKSRKGRGKIELNDDSVQRTSTEADLSPPRKRKDQQKTGLITGKDVSEEIAKTREAELMRFKQMDASASGQGAEPVYRIKGERVSKEEYLKLMRKEEKPKEEKKLEWGKGLAQKREAEARLLELEREKDKPFARSRDDPDLDRIMRDRLRWGDPMAHLVKRKQSDLALPDFGENEKMKESGFIIPQEIPSHSWIKRGLDFEPNRYGIKPGRHWDGVDRSNGYERQMFKRMNEKRATEREAYLWSVSDM